MFRGQTQKKPTWLVRKRIMIIIITITIIIIIIIIIKIIIIVCFSAVKFSSYKRSEGKHIEKTDMASP